MSEGFALSWAHEFILTAVRHNPRWTTTGLAMKVTIFHNPNCSTSRNVLQMIRDQGHEPEVVQYLKTPPTKKRLKELIAATGLPVRDVIRQKEAPYAELGLDKASEDQLLDAMVAHPILINRPIVETPKGARLCRPKEVLQEILP